MGLQLDSSGQSPAYYCLPAAGCSSRQPALAGDCIADTGYPWVRQHLTEGERVEVDAADRIPVALKASSRATLIPPN
ncbi:hypothetical protein A7K93_03890 [Candidatus Methylacidiphilum fumarolicum]|nr:hypothetical protein A7K72_05230 [Candidatus Methylacidiphilum fumarolicum]TFE74492.1 hypothetical protein A7K93_03890 [Candidatus Methylacidiphilum fumarolicum]